MTMDTMALQALVRRPGIIRLPRMTFEVDSPILVPSSKVIDGRGAVIDACHNGYVFLISGTRDICIRNLEIRGRWSGDDSALLGSAIQIQESQNVLVENVRITNMPGRGIVAASHVVDLRIRDCYICGCSISVFLFKGVRHARVEGCSIFNSRIIGIFVDDGTESDTQATARPNEYTIVSGNVVILGGISSRNMGVGVAVSGSTDTIVSGNIVRYFGDATHISHGIVLNNGQGGFSQGQRTVVSGNIISDNTGYGFYTVGQQDLVGSGNVFSNNGLGDCKFIP